MVVTFLPCTLEICVTQDRTGCPLRSTVQAPHRAAPQPNFVPVNPSVSRNTQSRGISATASTASGLPFKTNFTAAIQSPFASLLSLYVGTSGYSLAFCHADFHLVSTSCGSWAPTRFPAFSNDSVLPRMGAQYSASS